jgi:ABC-type polar amino acid transport system ATPase subunit
MINNNEIIVVKDLYKYFGDIKAVDGVSMSIEKGKVVVVIGPSGSGKSTLLRCINHLEEPTSGEVWIDGVQLTRTAKQLNEIRAEIGMVFQLFNLFPHLTAMENVTLAQKVIRGRTKDEAKSIVAEYDFAHTTIELEQVHEICRDEKSCV